MSDISGIRFHFNASKLVGPRSTDGPHWIDEHQSRSTYTERNMTDFACVLRMVLDYEKDGYDVGVIARIGGHRRTIYATSTAQMTGHEQAISTPGTWIRDCGYTGFNMAAFCRKFGVEEPA